MRNSNISLLGSLPGPSAELTISPSPSFLRALPSSLSSRLLNQPLLSFPLQSKNYNVLLGATGSAVKYSFRLTTLLCSFSLLSSLFSQSFKKAKIWRDEDRLARSLVRNYDGLGNSKTEEEEKEAGGEGTMQRLWPNEDGFELWDWVGGVGSGMAAGGIMTVGLGLYRE